MIYYFSATGNSKRVAKKIAEKTGDRACSLLDIDNSLDLMNEKQFGIVAPTYAWRLPAIVEKILLHTNFSVSENTYVFFVSTYGGAPGLCNAMACDLLRRQNISTNAVYGVKMPDTWTPMFDVSDKGKVEALVEKSEAQIDLIIERIIGKETVKPMGKLVLNLILPLANSVYNSMRRTKKFYVEDSCIGCGLCAEKCPIGAIEMRGNKPAWIVERCEMCVGCMHRCPKFSIQYGSGKTKCHGQYYNPHTKS